MFCIRWRNSEPFTYKINMQICGVQVEEIRFCKISASAMTSPYSRLLQWFYLSDSLKHPASVILTSSTTAILQLITDLTYDEFHTLGWLSAQPAAFHDRLSYGRFYETLTVSTRNPCGNKSEVRDKWAQMHIYLKSAENSNFLRSWFSGPGVW